MAYMVGIKLKGLFAICNKLYQPRHSYQCNLRHKSYYSYARNMGPGCRIWSGSCNHLCDSVVQVMLAEASEMTQAKLYLPIYLSTYLYAPIFKYIFIHVCMYVCNRFMLLINDVPPN